MLVACCLLYRALIPRCRLHLLFNITLRRREDLTSVVTMLQKHPHLIDRVRHLDIDVQNTASQSWVSTVPLSLPITSMKLQTLNLSGVDFTHLHSTFHMACSRFSQVEMLSCINVRYTRYSQLTRLAHATRAAHFYCRDASDPAERDNISRAIAVYPRGSVSLPRCVTQLDWYIPWSLLEKVLQGLLRQGSDAHWPRFLRFYVDEPPHNVHRRIYTAALKHIVQLYEQIFRGRHDKFDVSFSTAPFDVSFHGE